MALTAIGRKMTVLAVFSLPGLSRSARTATASPMMTLTTGTISIQSRVL